MKGKKEDKAKRKTGKEAGMKRRKRKEKEDKDDKEKGKKERKTRCREDGSM